MILKAPNFFFFCLTFSCFFAAAQFNNTLENDKARPVLTPSEAETDSAGYKGPALTTKDRVTNFTHWVWTGFDKYKSQSRKDSSYIFYSRTQGAAKPTVEMRISTFPGDCRNGDQTLKASAPVVGPAGEVYICWAGPKGLSFQRSLDSGVTWFSPEKIIVPIINGWDQKVDGVTLDCTPRMAVDLDGAYKGRIYIIWSDEKNSEKNKDVFLVYSDNRGENWTEPVLLSYRTNHKEQFQPQISVQPGTGKLFVTFFDKQNYQEQKGLVDLYLGISANGGLKFDFYRLNQERILLDSSIASVRGLVFIPKTEDAKIVWTQMTEGGRLHFYSVLVNDTAIQGYVAREQEMEMVLPKTINYSSNAAVDFTLKKESKVRVVATKPLDPRFSLEILKDSDFPAGPNHIEFNFKKLGLKKDNYILTFYYSGRNSSLWILR
jgi:hypothetical protein